MKTGKVKTRPSDAGEWNNLDTRYNAICAALKKKNVGLDLHQLETDYISYKNDERSYFAKVQLDELSKKYSLEL